MVWFAVFILLAPAAGKSLSSGQRIRITGISPLRGSLRAVSGSTIIILAVIAYMRSCLMVCDGILAQPLLFQEGHRVPHRWLSPGLMSQCLTIQFSMFSRGLRKRSLYLYQLGGPIFTPLWVCFRNIFKIICFLSEYHDKKSISAPIHQGLLKRSLYYICNGRGQIMPPCFEKNKKIYFLSRYMDNKIEIIYVQGML